MSSGDGRHHRMFDGGQLGAPCQCCYPQDPQEGPPYGALPVDLHGYHPYYSSANLHRAMLIPRHPFLFGSPPQRLVKRGKNAASNQLLPKKAHVLIHLLTYSFSALPPKNAITCP
ncbi:hypothetical protein JTE90_016278 [Oedothorax gibbosus]|uniref:Uncharacterized protein n=1 Tax=Oedothorax gibbosus TaxID=931172 RepID=A0AAV6TUY9_9ARAC|nr:hypothetical protein JTE90_016278 [Oedothorax gibbosus]